MPYTPVQTNGKSYTIQKLLGSIKMDKMAIRWQDISCHNTPPMPLFLCFSWQWRVQDFLLLLRSESPSSMCTKLHTVAASNNRDHPTRSLYYCLFVPHIYGYYSSHTSHSWWITHSMQHQPRGCNNIPFFLQQTAPITCSFCEVSTWHELHILVKAPFCCDQKDWASSAKSFTLWQQATIEIMHCNHSVRMPVIMFNRSQVSIGRDFTPQSLYYCLFTPHINGCYFSHTSHSWWSHIQHKANGEVATLSLIEKNKFSRHLFSQSMMWQESVVKRSWLL